MPQLAFIHTSPAAIAPLMKYYKEHGPEYAITNLLDDGLLRFFRENNKEAIVRRLTDMITIAQETYDAQLALITCTSVSATQLEAIRQQVSVPVLKVDVPMAAAAVAAGTTLGVVISFPPGGEHAMQLLRDQAAAAKKDVRLVPIVVPEAYDALLGGDPAQHDERLLAAIREKSPEVDAIVLSQVSMAELQPRAEAVSGKKVLSSPSASLAAIQKMI